MRWGAIVAIWAALAACNGDAVAPASGSAKPAPHALDGGAPAGSGSGTGSGSAAAPTVSSKGYVGVIAAAQMLDVAPLVAGRIATVNVRAGDEVKAGDVVAEMDPTSMQEELRAAQAALTAAQAAYRQAAVDVEDARRKYTLEKKAVADGVSPRQNAEEAAIEVKRAVANAERAAANVAAEKSRVETARDHVGNTKLTAQFDGIVQLRLHDMGSTVQAGEAIVRILGRSDLRLRFAVPPDRTKKIPKDTKVVATVDTVSAPVPAVVRQVAPALDPASGMVIVEATLTADPATIAQLRPGLAAWVTPP